jgi:acyl dehydratase
MRTHELSRPPRLLCLDAKAAVGAIPGVSRAPFLDRGADVPDLELALDEISVDPSHLARYRRVCGYEPGDELPPTYPHAVAFPLHLALLTHSEFPFAAVGLVHMANEITRSRPIGTGESLNLRVHLSSLEPHPRGQSFQIVTEVRAGGEPAWRERCTIIHRKEGEGSADDGSSEGEGSRPHVPTTETWRIPSSTGFRYALASGDHNPIHVHRIPARISGLPGLVAPGMWTKARALASVVDRLPGAMTAVTQFLRPIVLPTAAQFGVREDDGIMTVAVRDPDSGKPHMTGTVRRAEP